MLGLIGGLITAIPKVVKFATKVLKPAAKVAAVAGTYAAAERAVESVTNRIGGGTVPQLPAPAAPSYMPAMPAAPSVQQPVLSPQPGSSMVPVATPGGGVLAPPRTWGVAQRIEYLYQFRSDPKFIQYRPIAPPGYVVLTRRSTGEKFIVDKQAARRAGVWKPTPKPLLSAADGRCLRKAESITKKIEKVAKPALKTRGKVIKSKFDSKKKARKK